MAEALYRKYRSRKLDDVVGQDTVVKTLKNALKNGAISHAYLFTGPHGVGKTSVARILAHEVNRLDYQDDKTIHLDIIEIDAASNRRIDEIRELRDKVHIAPTSAKYKVYIIDEVHMLTKEAFNALLKTLEEPPEHCIFILATTEAHKLPETIVSRTQRFNFRPIDSSESAAHLAAVAKKEKIDIEPAALELLASFGEGSLRDSLSLLDQLAAKSQQIDEKAVRQSLGIPSAAAVAELVASLAAGDSRGLVERLDQLRTQGINPAVLAKQLGASLRQSLIEGEVEPTATVELARQLVEVPASLDPQAALELALLSTAAKQKVEDQPAANAEAVAPAAVDQSPADVVRKSSGASFSLDDWAAYLEAVKAEATSLYTALRLAEPSLAGNELTLAFQFPLHQKKINRPEALKKLAEIANQTFGAELIIKCVVDKSVKKASPAQAPAAAADQIQIISNIFGGGEVLES